MANWYRVARLLGKARAGGQGNQLTAAESSIVSDAHAEDPRRFKRLQLCLENPADRTRRKRGRR